MHEYLLLLRVYMIYGKLTWLKLRSGNLKGLSKLNKGYKYLLTVIDTFSKYSWAMPVKNKTGKEVTRAFASILKQLNKHQSFCKQIGVESFITLISLT